MNIDRSIKKEILKKKIMEKRNKKKVFGRRNNKKGSTKLIIYKRRPHMSGSVPVVV
jgi:hypothetical protein